MSKKFGGIRQVGYVVKDIEKAMDHWSRVLGVGPWFHRLDATPSTFTYYGEASQPPRLSIAIANSGDLQIELIEQFDDAPSLYRDSLQSAGECAQHIAYWTEDEFDSMRQRLLAEGYREGHAGQMGGRGRFSYLLHPGLPSAVIEISELRGGKGEYFKKVAAAAAGWNGQDAIIQV
jgi:catechol 2,3-dioxygenase-like lactoylglutathione lyase family enzyme